MIGLQQDKLMLTPRAHARYQPRLNAAQLANSALALLTAQQQASYQLLYQVLDKPFANMLDISRG